MDIQFFNYEKYKVDVSGLKNKILFICKNRGLTGYIGIEFVSIDKIRKINKKYRTINKPTDVLSFSTRTQKKNQIFGEIIISPKFAKKLNEKTIDLIIHGIIHLLGYDHEENEKEWNKVLKQFQV